MLLLKPSHMTTTLTSHLEPLAEPERAEMSVAQPRQYASDRKVCASAGARRRVATRARAVVAVCVFAKGVRSRVGVGWLVIVHFACDSRDDDIARQPRYRQEYDWCVVCICAVQ